MCWIVVKLKCQMALFKSIFLEGDRNRKHTKRRVILPGVHYPYVPVHYRLSYIYARSNRPAKRYRFVNAFQNAGAQKWESDNKRNLKISVPSSLSKAGNASYNHLKVKGISRLSTSNCFEASTCRLDIEAANSHILHVSHTRKIESDHDHQVAEQKNRPLEIIALSLAIHVAEEEDAEDNSYHIPLWENKTEGAVNEILAL